MSASDPLLADVVVVGMQEGLPDVLSGMWKVAVLRCSTTAKRPPG